MTITIVIFVYFVIGIVLAKLLKHVLKILSGDQVIIVAAAWPIIVSILGLELVWTLVVRLFNPIIIWVLK